MKTYINENELQVSGYPTILIRVTPDPNSYYRSGFTISGTNDVNEEVVLEEILRKHSAAWKKLASL